MNNCDSPDVPPTNGPANKKAHFEHAHQLGSKENNSKPDGLPKQPNEHRKMNHNCLHNIGPPPRPFKKARYAWEIKNYDYTIKKMTQSINNNKEAEDQAKSAHCPEVKDQCNSSNDVSSACVPVSEGGAACNTIEKNVGEVQNAEPQLSPTEQTNIVEPFVPTSYHAHYEAIMGPQQNVQHTLPHTDCLNSIHAQISPDPDARLLRWHTRQLCRSIFDNTVNRMLENMGFSPMTDRTQALHPLLVLSLNEQERDAEEMHQQALSAALHQKGFLPPQYGYDHLESANTSDYDSSEEDSDLGDGGHDDSNEHPTLHPPSPQSGEELTYFTRQSQNPSLQHIGDKAFSYLSSHAAVNQLHQANTETCDHHCNSAQYLCDYQKICGANKLISAIHSTGRDGSNHLQNEGILDAKGLERNAKELSSEYLQMCLSRKCGSDRPTSNEDNTLDGSLKVDGIKPETVIAGKVERVLDDHHTTEIGLDNNVNKNRDTGNSNDSYFVRNAIHMAIKQQGLGFQRA